MAKKLTTAQKLLVAAIMAVALGSMVWVVVEEKQRDEVRVATKVDIIIGYTDLYILEKKVIPAIGADYKAYHTFVLAQDPETKDGFVTRAGPERKCDDSGFLGLGSGSKCPRFCKQAVSGKKKMWAHSFSGTGECLPTLHKQYVGTINRSLNSVANQMKHLAEVNNTCNSKKYSTGFPARATLAALVVQGPIGAVAAPGLYCSPPYNSNSYAFSVVEKLMGRQRPEPVGTYVKYLRCEYDPAHGWDEVVNLNEC